MPPRQASNRNEKPSGKDHIIWTLEEDCFLLLDLEEKMNQGHSFHTCTSEKSDS
ncbi:hypothetical protein CROQUDRAFT_95140 [Cronartium quercuum f. sp. fusiforme G11]|uniref:Uncharacterized protein n=1 Tax=Cronartium quercuum f. sp. fusiforme G11 TaxID=708437 RepID=A0A9P6NHL2_9BASI|nr:hypothetical protein CROQUDRAFT_95140 [Cronartium quercuum f. sp. fusiforme G11]